MKQNAFYEIFLEQLKNIYDAENQVLNALPKIIQSVENGELKESLVQYLDETKTQILRLKTIFKTLNEEPAEGISRGMRGIIEECDQVLSYQRPSCAKDSYLIVCCQKIEHYQIAAYGCARTIANHLNHAQIDERIDFDEIASILQLSLDEEGSANETLTDIAEGGFFTEGINDIAEKEASLK